MKEGWEFSFVRMLPYDDTGGFLSLSLHQHWTVMKIRRSKSDKEAAQFSRDFITLIGHIISDLKAAESVEEVTTQFEILKGLASYGMPQAVTFYGLAYMMDDKPWYDSKKGMDILKKAAEGDDAQSGFIKHELGKIYMEGRKGLAPDPVSGRYWIRKAAELGYRPAVKDVETRWG